MTAMKSKIAIVATAFAAAGLMLAPVAAVAKPKPTVKTACKTHYGKGWAPTEGMARFQAWEITAQVTGNWPIKTDTFKNERYNCKPDGSGFTCRSKIDVCATP